VQRPQDLPGDGPGGTGEPGLAGWLARHRLLVLLPVVAVTAHWVGGLRVQPDPRRWAALHVALLVVVGLGTALARIEGERERRAIHTSMQATIDAQRAAVAELRRTEALKTQLLSIVNHEFRTPLTGILGFSKTLQAQIAAGSASPDAVATGLDRIQRNSTRLARVVGNMLAVATDVELVNVADHGLRDAVTRVVREVDPSGASEVVLDVPPGLVVRSAAEHLRLVLVNLVDNAVKFADPGTVVAVRARAVGDQVTLTVANDGPPIPDAMASRIFAPFVQVDSSETRRYEGLGLGLHVVHRICAAYGGELELLRQGRTVVLATTLPAGAHGPAATSPDVVVEVTRTPAAR
jgi:signal transduction histidine kinase